MTKVNRRILELSVAIGLISLTLIIVQSKFVDAVLAVAILFIPGIVILMATDLDYADSRNEAKLFWAAAASVSIVAIGGLFLNVVAELSRSAWIIYLASVSGLLLVVAWGRNWKNKSASEESSESRGRFRLSWVFSAAAVVALGFLVLGSNHRVSTVTTASLGGTTNIDLLKKCPSIHASGTIHYISKPDSSGNYQILALGTIYDRGSTSIKNVVVTWIVKYADLSDGTPTESKITGWNIPTGGSADWGGTAARDDGKVPPVGVQIIKVSGAPAGAVCLS